MHIFTQAHMLSHMMSACMLAGALPESLRTQLSGHARALGARRRQHSMVQGSKQLAALPRHRHLARGTRRQRRLSLHGSDRCASAEGAVFW